MAESSGIRDNPRIKSAYPLNWLRVLEYGATGPATLNICLKSPTENRRYYGNRGTPVHMNFMKTRNRWQKKNQNFENLFTSNFAILNFDDEIAMGMKEKTRENNDIRI